MAPVPAFMPISWRIGPLTTAMAAIALELLLRAVTPDAARARMTGKYSGRAPAITAFLGRQHDRQHVRPPVVEEQTMQVVLGVGLDEPGRGAVERDGPELGVGE